jgi:hypothetical protein
MVVKVAMERQAASLALLARDYNSLKIEEVKCEY